MTVEQENRFLASFASVQRRRSRSGTRLAIVCAKSALITRASRGRSPRSSARRSPCGRRKRSRRPALRAGSVTPRPRATRAMASIIAPHPPRGWNTPYSYSRNARMVNRLGHLNGDIPRYLLWKENASRTRGSLKCGRDRRRHCETDAEQAVPSAGRGVKQARQLEKGRCRIGRKASNFARFSVDEARHAAASAGDSRAISRCDPRQIGARADLATALEHQMVHGIEAEQIDLVLEPMPAGRERSRPAPAGTGRTSVRDRT